MDILGRIREPSESLGILPLTRQDADDRIRIVLVMGGVLLENSYVYIVFSSTPYRIGRMIRRVTRERYNHVSIALDEELTQMYGFARRYYRTPLYGGFVKESTSRYCFEGKTTDIRLCRLPVSAQQYRQLSERLDAIYEQREHYLYNYLTVLSSPFRRRFPVQDAYICTEFCAEVLHGLGQPVDPEKYYSVGQLESLLERYTVYTGPIPHTAPYDTEYYADKPIPHPVLTSMRCFFALFPRPKR